MFNIGQCHRFLGNLEKAIFSYSQYVRDNPGTPDALFVQGLIRRLKKRLQAESQKREKAQLLFEEGRKRLNLNQFRQALDYFMRAYKAFPLPGYLYHIAESHRGLKQCAKAIPFYQNYLRENPAAPRSKHVHARIKKCRKQLDKERKRRHHQDRLNKAIKGTGREPVTIRSRPFYKKWWFWTAVAVGVGAAVGLGVGLGLREKPAELPEGALGTLDMRR
jgi:tetratricopeptide (TPR) repeat protein